MCEGYFMVADAPWNNMLRVCRLSCDTMRGLQNFYVCWPFSGVETMSDLRGHNWCPACQPLSWSRRFQGGRKYRGPAWTAYSQDEEKRPFPWRAWSVKGAIRGVDQRADLTPPDNKGLPETVQFIVTSYPFGGSVHFYPFTINPPPFADIPEISALFKPCVVRKRNEKYVRQEMFHALPVPPPTRYPLGRVSRR